jgi:hypothetical protein
MCWSGDRAGQDRASVLPETVRAQSHALPTLAPITRPRSTLLLHGEASGNPVLRSVGRSVQRGRWGGLP